MTDARAAGLKRLKQRVERLHENLSNKVKVPELLIANEVVLIVMAARMYCPETFGKALANDEHRLSLLSSGFCVRCEKDVHGHTHAAGFCLKCSTEIDDDQPRSN